MRWNTLARTKVACAYFFVVPGLVYALLVSRLPALKEQVGANEAEVGFILLSYGLSGLVGLILSAPIIRKLTSRRVLRVASLSLLFALPVTALATSPLTLGLACICVGLGTGFVDVAMNAQAIEVEKHHNVRCLAFMHAGYGLGGMLGSVSAAVFAGIGVTPLWNFGLLMVLLAILRPFTVPRLLDDTSVAPRPEETDSRAGTGKKSRALALPPLFVIFCGVVAGCNYATEGSVGEWGALFLCTKGAGEQTAALVYGVFSLAAVFCRLVTDVLRTHHEDFHIMLCGSLLAVAGMATVLFVDSAILALFGYACMGFGLAPIVPILFSRAGSCPGVSAGTASAVVSVLAYSALLLFPPLIGSLPMPVTCRQDFCCPLASPVCLSWPPSSSGRERTGVRGDEGGEQFPGK